MGVFTDLTTGSSNISPSKPRVGLDRSCAQQLLCKAAQYNPSPVPTAYAARDEVQKIVEQTGAGVGDTYTLTFSIPLTDETFTTAAIAYNATAATIETAINVAATLAAITGWTNGDISVAEENAAGLDDGYCTFTFDGTSMDDQPHDLIVLTATGFTKTGIATRETAGQQVRSAMFALICLNVLSGTLHYSLETPSYTKPACNSQTRPRSALIKVLALEAAKEDCSDLIYDAILALYPHIANV